MLKKAALPLAVSFACLSLTACGGGGGGELSGADSTIQSQAKAPASALAASTISLQGLATSVNGPITSASWQQTGGPAVLLTNSACTDATSTPQGGTSGASTVLNYVCTTGVTLPNVQQATDFSFQFTAFNAVGGVSTSKVTVAVSPAIRTPLTVTAGPSQGVLPGQIYSGSCAAISNAVASVNTGSGSAAQSPAINYQWQIQATSGSGGLPVLNTSPNGAVSFVAPTLSTPTDYTLTCQATDSLGNTGSAVVNVTDYGTSALPPLVVSAGNAQVAAVNTQVKLQASATTRPASSTPIYYYWTQTGGPSVSLANANTATPSFVYAYTLPPSPASSGSAPASSGTSGTTSALATLTFTVYASYQPITASDLSAIPASQQASTSVVITN
jgi:hypothetical protein